MDVVASRDVDFKSQPCVSRVVANDHPGNLTDPKKRGWHPGTRVCRIRQQDYGYRKDTFKTSSKTETIRRTSVEVDVSGNSDLKRQTLLDLLASLVHYSN